MNKDNRGQYSDYENPNNPLSISWVFKVMRNNPPSVDPNLNPRVSTGREYIRKKNRKKENNEDEN